MNTQKTLRTAIVSSCLITLLCCGLLAILFSKRITSLEQKRSLPIETSSSWNSSAETLEQAIIASIAMASKSVVSITVSKDIKVYVQDPAQLNGPGNIQQQTSKIWWWSGIIIAKDGYLITNKHVVQDTTAKYAVTLFDGSTYSIDKIWFDDNLDIAIMKIAATSGKQLNTFIPATFLPITTPIAIGQFALTIGNSLGNYPNNVSLWLLWGKNKQITINQNNHYIGLYQTDALVNPGNSWGPLLDINGNVLGITTAITEGQGIAFALPISKEFVAGTLRTLEKFWKIVRPIIWIQYTEKAMTTWVIISDVLADLPWFQAGLKPWDIILRINNITITQSIPFLYQLYTHIPGETISLSLLRDNKELTLPVTLAGNTQ